MGIIRNLYTNHARPDDDSLAGWNLAPTLFTYTNEKGDLYARPYDGTLDLLLAPALGRVIRQP